VSTFSFCPLIDEDADVAPLGVELDELLIEPLSIVPVISTLWPTCALSLASSASSLYVPPAADDDGVDVAPEVPVGFVLPAALPDDGLDELVALVRMKFESVVLLGLVPLVPVAPEVAPVARATHPVTVI